MEIKAVTRKAGSPARPTGARDYNTQNARNLLKPRDARGGFGFLLTSFTESTLSNQDG